MRRVRLAAVALLFLFPAASFAATLSARRDFAVPPTALDAALARFAEQSGVDVGTPALGLPQVRSPGVAGRMSPRSALDRLLAGTGYRAVALRGGGYRIEPRPAPARPIPPVPSSPPTPALVPPELVVIASKRNAPLLRFPSSATVVDAALGGAGWIGTNNSLADAAAEAPTVQATALGAGRNKLFIRGIADSSFLGPTASTTSVYFGNVLLAYNGPSPNLTLVDVDRVEIIEGPQGTLYGAGSIGGVIKLTPRVPDLSAVSGSAAAGLTVTKGGAVGHDESAVLNLPVLDDEAGLRLVAYQSTDGGYVDDSERGLRNINSTRALGGRAALRVVPGDGWVMDAGLVLHTIDSPDSQYALRGLPELTRRSALKQPFRDDFLLNRIEIAKDWDGGLRLVSATGYALDDARERFDATMQSSVALAYDTTDRNHLFSQETRLSRKDADGGGWLVGAALFRDRDVTSRAYGPLDAQRTIAGVTNRTVNAALFGEATAAVTPALAITGGARITYARIDSEASATRDVLSFVRGRRQTRFDPTIGVSWLALSHVALFARYQPGFRTGGLAVAPGIGRVAEFRPDDIHVAEGGIRLERSGALGLAASATLSYAHWRNIQADLVDGRGFPFTANVGDGRIKGVESEANWIPVAALHLAGGLFLANSRGGDPARGIPFARAIRLPDTPRFSGSFALGYDFPLRDGTTSLSADIRYVGPSYLDPTALLNIRQGDYKDLGLAANWRLRTFAFSLAIDNLANARGDRFALGNPFGVASGEQYTPLRPRNARFSASIGW